MDDGTLYMMMELLDGQDLHQVLKARDPLPIDEAARHITALLGPAAMGDDVPRPTLTPINRDDPTVTNATSSRPSLTMVPVRAVPRRSRAAATFIAARLVLTTGVTYFASASRRASRNMVASTVAVATTLPQSAPTATKAAPPPTKKLKGPVKTDM